MAGSSAYLARSCTDEAFMAETACCLQHWVYLCMYKGFGDKLTKVLSLRFKKI